ncbi:MAG TPA: hypothetical protein VFX43_09795, partial [Chitinophagaceae bacterium]|nr:hypothetical protein [Chitinophagaceae bacterium]
MKKFSYPTIAAAVILLVLTQWGCRKAGSFLDKKSTNSLNESTVFADSARTMDYLAGVYQGLLIWRVSKDNATDPNASLCAVTDEANQRYPASGMLENQMIT